MSTPPSAMPPANWYPDPQTPGQLRYWDGQRWTAHVHQPQQQQPAQAASGYATPGPQTASNPLASAVQQSDAGVYTPVMQPSPTIGSRPVANPGQQASGPATGGTFLPPGPQAAGPATGGTFLPPGQQAAGPATGGMFLPTGQQAAGGGFPATGATPAFPATGSIGAIQPGATAASPGMLQAPKPRNLDDEDEGHGGGATTAPLAAVAAVLGVAAIGIAALSIFGLGTDFDKYLPYASGGLGFFAILFGFLGRKKAAAGFMGGAAFAWAGIGGGFLSILLSTYEVINPGELYEIFSDYL